MSNIKDNKTQKEKIFPAMVVGIIDNYKVVINRGSLHNVEEGQLFLVYALSREEIKDPVSRESLGYLEIVKGTGRIIHVQEKMSTIESDKREPSERKIFKKRNAFSFSESEEETVISPGKLVPFNKPEIGDKAKPI